MNEWILKSIEVANAPKYLDALSEIYPMNVNPVRPLPHEIANEIRVAFVAKKTKKLVRLLIEHSEVFPVKDSYVGFMRKKPEAIDENPKTINRIGERLYSLGFDRMIQEAQRPKETNRQLGHSFKNWVSTLGYGMVSCEEMKRSTRGICILKGSDDVLGGFARKELKCTIKKGIDFVAKKDSDYIIGEAKFLTTPGGEQDRGFDDASSFIGARSGKATRIALIDGYIWLRTISGLHEKITNNDGNIMSALLLSDFIRKF